MHTSIKMNTPCEFINVTTINPLISHCEIKVCYVSDEPNRNGSIITKKVGRELAKSLPGSPIVGYYNSEDKDFEEHNRELNITKDGQIELQDTTKPYGFVDLNARCWFQKFLDDGIEHEYLMTEGYLWTGQYPEAQRIIERGNNQSMELDPGTIDGEWSKGDINEPQFFIINEAIISKLCILGENYEPCFEGATITKMQFSYGESFKNQLFSMIEQLKEILNEGGTLVEMNKEIETSVVEEEVVTVEETAETPEEVEKPVVDFAQEEKEEEEKVDEEEVCPECGKPESECHCDEKDEDKKDKKDKYNLDEIQEYVELSNNYSTLTEKYAALENELNSLKAEHEELMNFKKSVEKQEKQAMIDSFYMLSAEDKKEVQENIDTYSLDEIEAKLSIICVRNKVSFDLAEESEKQNNPTTYNLNDVQVDCTPAWIKAVQSFSKKEK